MVKSKKNFFLKEKHLNPIEIVKISKNFLRRTYREFQELQFPFFIDSNRFSRSRDMSLTVRSSHRTPTIVIRTLHLILFVSKKSNSLIYTTKNEKWKSCFFL